MGGVGMLIRPGKWQGTAACSTRVCYDLTSEWSDAMLCHIRQSMQSSYMFLLLSFFRHCYATNMGTIDTSTIRCHIHTSRSPTESFSFSNPSLSSQKETTFWLPFHILQGPRRAPLLGSSVRARLSSSQRLTKQTNTICSSQSCIHIVSYG